MYSYYILKQSLFHKKNKFIKCITSFTLKTNNCLFVLSSYICFEDLSNRNIILNYIKVIFFAIMICYIILRDIIYFIIYLFFYSPKFGKIFSFKQISLKFIHY